MTMIIAFSATPAAAKTISKSTLKKVYKSWLIKHDYDLDYSTLTFVDIDKNGVIEAICQGNSIDACLLTYNKSKRKVVIVKRGTEGKVYSPFSYNKKKHMFASCGASRWDEWATFYKLKGKKAIQKKYFYTDYEVYKVNGKNVSAASYQRQFEAAKKGFKGGWFPYSNH